MENAARQQLRDRLMEQLKYSILSDSFVTFLRGNESDQQILGSGTLVSIGEATAILTADHVLAKLPNPIRVFFPTRFDDSPRSTPGPPKTIKYSEKRTIGRGTDEAEGPDLGLLIIHKCDIPFAKTFYSITKHGSRALTEPWSNDNGGWALVGAPAEWTRCDAPDARFATVKEQRVLIGATDVKREFEKDGFDYLDIATNYNDSGYGGPTRFGGCSGGGLWRVDLNQTTSGEINVCDDPILSGVAFYQSPPCDGMIRCHGRKSIYQRVIQAFHT